MFLRNFLLSHQTQVNIRERHIMKEQMRDRELMITSSWAQDCHRLDLIEITVSYNCLAGTMYIQKSTLLSAEKFFADSVQEVERVNCALKSLGLTTESSGQYTFQYLHHQLREVDGSRKRKCSNGLEAMRFINSIAAALGKDPDAYTGVTVRREILIDDTWVDEGKVLCVRAQQTK